MKIYYITLSILQLHYIINRTRDIQTDMSTCRKITTIKAIFMYKSITGIDKPLAECEPILLDGILYNYVDIVSTQFMNKHKLMTGTRIMITKNGSKNHFISAVVLS